MRPASQRVFKLSCIYLRILIISYLATFLGTNSLSVLTYRKAVSQSISQSVNQSINQSINLHVSPEFLLYYIHQARCGYYGRAGLVSNYFLVSNGVKQGELSALSCFVCLLMIFCLHYLPILSHTLAVYDEICKRSMKLIATTLVSSSQLVQSIANYCVIFGRYRSFLGTNALLCCDQYNWSLSELISNPEHIKYFLF